MTTREEVIEVLGSIEAHRRYEHLPLLLLHDWQLPMITDALIAAFPHLVQDVVTTVEELDALPDVSVLLSETRNKKYGHRKLIQVCIQGEAYWVEGGLEKRRGMDEFLPARVLYRGGVA